MSKATKEIRYTSHYKETAIYKWNYLHDYAHARSQLLSILPSLFLFSLPFTHLAAPEWSYQCFDVLSADL